MGIYQRTANICGDLSKNDKYACRFYPRTINIGEGFFKERQIFVEIYQRTINIRGDLSKNDKIIFMGFYQRTTNIRGDLLKNDKYAWRFYPRAINIRGDSFQER